MRLGTILYAMAMSQDSSRQGRPHTVVVTVRIEHALDARDALAAALVGVGEVVDAVVTEGTTESGAQTLVSMILQSRLH